MGRTTQGKLLPTRRPHATIAARSTSRVDLHIDVKGLRTLDIAMGAASHTGRVRAVNQDAYLAQGHVGVIADGMGGHAAGEVASRLAVESFNELAAADSISPEAIHSAIRAANAAILAEVVRMPERDGMGTTITGVALVDYAGSPHWMVFNVGDSRVYRVSASVAMQLTVDHSEVSELVALGKITAEQAKTHPLRSVVTRSLGSEKVPETDVWIFPTNEYGDVFVICSDGVTNELSDSELAQFVSIECTPSEIATKIVEAAVSSGGRDNATVVVVALGSSAPHEELADTAPRPPGGWT